MGLIRYKEANSMGAASGGVPGPRAPGEVDWEESSEKKSLSLRAAFAESTTWTTVGLDGSFTVNDSTYLALVEALDACPFVYRAGGAKPSTADPTRTD